MVKYSTVNKCLYLRQNFQKSVDFAPNRGYNETTVKDNTTTNDADSVRVDKAETEDFQ